MLCFSISVTIYGSKNHFACQIWNNFCLFIFYYYDKILFYFLFFILIWWRRKKRKHSIELHILKSMPQIHFSKAFVMCTNKKDNIKANETIEIYAMIKTILRHICLGCYVTTSSLFFFLSFNVFNELHDMWVCILCILYCIAHVITQFVHASEKLRNYTIQKSINYKCNYFHSES